MPVNVVTYGDISPRTAGFVSKRMLERGQYDYVIGRYGQAQVIPKKNTKTIKFRRYESLPRATAPLAEAVPPAAGKLTYTDVQATLEQYGYYVPLSDVVLDTHEDPVLQETSDLCGEQISETTEVITISVLKGGTTVYYANNAGSRANVNSPLLRSDLRRIYRYLKKYKGRPISKIIAASVKISTDPVAPAYFVFGHTDLDSDIRAIEGFIPVENYSDSTKAVPGEIGKVDQFRFILTPLFEAWEAAGASGTTYLSGGVKVSVAAAADVYPLLILAENAFGTVRLQGPNTVTPAVVNPKPMVGDELAQRGFVSWKMYFTSIILNQNWLCRLECAATAIPT